MAVTEKIFAKRGISASGRLLPPSEFKFFRDFEGQSFNPERMAAVVKKAEEYLDYEFPIITLSSYRRYVQDGNRGQMEALYFPRRTALINLAMAEYFERKGRFTNKLIDVIWAILEESTWLISAHFRYSIGAGDGVPNFFGDIRTHDLALFAAATSAELALVYYYCKDILDEVSPYIAERIKYEVTERAIKPYLTKIYFWTGEGRRERGNWLTWIISNMLVVCGVFADDMNIRERMVQRALNSLDIFFDAYNPDGGCDEGPAYWECACGAMLTALEILWDLSGGKIDIFDHPLIEKMAEYAPSVNLFDNVVANFADSARKVTVSGTVLKKYADRINSPLLNDFAHYMSGLCGNHALGHSIPYSSIMSLYGDVVEPTDMISAPRSVYYDYIKVAVMREYEVRGKGLTVAVKGGHNAENHNHNDVGTFMLYKDKTPVIIDLGKGEYINWQFATREKCIQKYSDYHNLPTFDGKWQVSGADAKSENESFNDENQELKMQIASAWGKDSGVLSFERRVKLDNSKLTLQDTVELQDDTDIDFSFVTPEEPSIHDAAVLLAGGVKLSLDREAEISVEPFDTSYCGAKTFGVSLYRVHFKVRTKSGSFTFTFE